MLVRRVVKKAIEVIGGTLFLSPITQAVWRNLPVATRHTSPDGDGGLTAPAAPLRCAVVAHVYYTDLLPEVLACWSHIDGLADGQRLAASVPLHITTTEDREGELRSCVRALANPAITVHVAPNRGRDIAPFITLLNRGVFNGYDAVLKLHTKKSPHLWAGHLRRRLLFTVLAGTPRQVLQARACFLDPEVGMVGWTASFRRKPSWWMGNEARVRALAAGMPQVKVVPGFFEGSMFWFRPAALAALRQRGLGVDDFEPEHGQIDGTLHHAVERMFTLSAWAGGYRVCSMSGVTLKPGDASASVAPAPAR